MRVPSYGFRKRPISADSQYMSTAGLISGPITLNFCKELGSILIHRPLLAFCSPVPGFCAMVFTLISDESSCIIETSYWPCLRFGMRVDIYKIEVCANFQLSTVSVSQVTAFRKMNKISYKYISTAGLISGPIILKFWKKVNLIYIHCPLLAFNPPVPGFCAIVFTLIYNDLSRIIETSTWTWLKFGKWVDINKIEVCANF
jgi:hypothetical protein